MVSTHGYYHKRIQAAEKPHEANDYGSERSQQMRFRVVTDALGVRNGDSVVDVGCGTGEYGNWLWRNGYDVRYMGVDDHPKMVECARDNNLHVIQRNVLQDGVPNGDWCIALGVLGVIDGDEYQRWSAFAKLVRHLVGTSRKGCAFTMQGARGNWSEFAAVDDLRWYAAPSDIVGRLEQMFPGLRWQMRCDYHPFDVMVTIHKTLE